MTDQDTPSSKQPRFRSPPYPSIPLSKAIERATAFYTKALHHSVPIAVAASAWEYKEKSSGLFGTLATLKQFGLVVDEGAGDKRRFKLTESAMRIVRDPDPNSEKRKAAIRSAALAPKIHAELWDRYEAAGASGAMDVALKSYLTLDRSEDGAAPFSDAAAEEVIAEYRQTMAFAGLLESEDVSSVDGSDHDTGYLSESEDDAPLAPETPISPPTLPALPEGELNDIRAEFAGGKVRISAVMDLKGLEKLEKQIAAFKILLQ